MHIAVAGVTGRTGRFIVSKGLQRGHRIRALVRNLRSLEEAPDLELVLGDIDNLSALRELVRDCDLVISTIGPRPQRMDTCSASSARLIAAGAKRLIVVSGMALSLPTDNKSLVDKIASAMVRLIARRSLGTRSQNLKSLSAVAFRGPPFESECSWPAIVVVRR